MAKRRIFDPVRFEASKRRVRDTIYHVLADCAAGDQARVESSWNLLLTEPTIWDDADFARGTPMFAACANGHLRTAMWLGNFRHPLVDVRTRNKDGWSPMMAACAAGHLETAEWLWSVGARDDVAKGDHDGRTAIWYACANGHTSVARWLFDVGGGVGLSKTDEGGFNALSMACAGGHLPVVQLLVEKGEVADVRTQNKMGESPMLLACNTNIDLARWLFENTEARLDIRTPSENGIVPLAKACIKGELNILRWLHEVGAAEDVQTPTSSGNTPLHIACQQGFLGCASWLLSVGADCLVANRHGTTPLHHAFVYGHLAVAEELFRSTGGTFDTCAPWGSDRRTILHEVCSKGFLDVAKWLVVYGGAALCIRERNFYGRTPMYAACSGGHLKVARWLFNSGAGDDTRIPSTEGTTPLVAAYRSYHYEVVHWLILNGGACDAAGRMTTESLHVRRGDLSKSENQTTRLLAEALTQHAVFFLRVLPMGYVNHNTDHNPANRPIHHWRLMKNPDIMRIIAGFCGVIVRQELRNARAAANLLWGKGGPPPRGYWVG